MCQGKGYELFCHKFESNLDNLGTLGDLSSENRRGGSVWLSAKDPGFNPQYCGGSGRRGEMLPAWCIAVIPGA